MKNIVLNQILKKGHKLKYHKFNLNNKAINRLINDINIKQEEILRLKIIDLESLRKEIINI